ncbi:hypothetical protein F8568_039695 [Actinomadura sp. LD22]|uniref:Secreted protein n=1 Tax=Actinomadura physcomitrii TaxID=2650748 RepID=A0A6I4MRC3_9ACTN|nr:hypothetical protein [Actinomadura physcomitrii]MWA06367.1 hypothetical protein [Actinomadura physcomitrii]
MNLRTRAAVLAAALTTGLGLTVGVAALPAQAAPAAPAATWWDVGTYGTKSKCVDAGQQYEREGWPYRCLYVTGAGWVLEIWQ